MSRLLAAELLRFWSRRLVLVMVVVMVGMSALIAVPAGMATYPVTAAERAEAEQMAKEEMGYWEDDCGAEDSPDCIDWVPVASDYLRQPLTGREALDEVQGGRGWLVTLLILLLTGSFIAAEFRSGSIATWAMFHPNRSAVYFAKLGAAAVSTAVVTAVSWGVAILILAATIAIGGAPFGMPDAPARLALNAAGGALVATIGVGLAMLTRHTVAVVGVAIGAAVLESVVGLMILFTGPGAILRWLPSNQLDAVVNNGVAFNEMYTESDGPSVTFTITPVEGLVYWTLIAAGVTGLAILAFRRSELR